VICEKNYTTEKMVAEAERILEEKGYAHHRQILGIVAGTRTKSGSTNFLRLHVIGDAITEEPPQAREAELAVH
jgi:pyruvate kinase